MTITGTEQHGPTIIGTEKGRLSAYPCDDALLRNPTTGIARCCARGERPSRRAAETRDELAPFQLTEFIRWPASRV
jgi:hypothetical protein